MRVIDADGRHTVELVLQLEGGDGEWRPMALEAHVRDEDGGP